MIVAESRYATTAIVVHWLTAAALLLTITLGLRMTDAGGVERDSAQALHISLGVLILLLSIFRIVHRKLRRPPPLPNTARWEKWLAQSVHWALYASLIVVPLLGWLNISSAGTGSSSELFGILPWPGFPGVAGQSAIGAFAQVAHRFLAYGVCLLLVLHVAGAIRHHLADPRTGLARILPGERRQLGWRSASVGVVLTLLFLAGSGYMDPILPQALHLVRTQALERPFIDPRKSTVFAGVIQPIFGEKCTGCHGDRSQKGRLRLDTFAALSKGGESGKAIEAGKVQESELVRRIMLPRDDREAMPPAGKPVLAPADAQLLLWWIGTGADDHTTIAAADTSPLVAQILKDLGIRNESAVFAKPVPQADEAVLARLRESFQLQHLFAGGGFLRAQVPFVRDPGKEPPVDALAAIAEQLVWLDLSGTNLRDAELTGLAQLRKLQRLNLSGTQAGDRAVSQLAALPYLEILNLYGTRVSDASLPVFARMPALASVYLTGTAVTSPALERFTRSHPQINVIWQAAPADDTVIIDGRKQAAQSP